MIHIGVMFFTYYLFLNFNCNLKKLLILNTWWLIILYFFFIFKRCILSILSEKILGSEYTFMGVSDRMNYFLNYETEYTRHPENKMFTWMSNNTTNTLIIIMLNLYCISKIYLK